MNRRLLVAVLVLAVASGGFLAGVSADADYEITFPEDDEHVEVPEQTVTFEGETYAMSAIGVADPDGSFDVVVETDSGDTFNVNLRDSEQNVMDARSRVTDGERLTFDADELQLDPGTYMLQVEDGLTQALTPVVIQAYDVSSPEPDREESEIEPGDEVTVTTTLSDIEPQPISDVELVVWNGDDHERLSMSNAGEGSYERTVELAAGSYDMYVIGYGEDEIEDQDEKEMIAVSQHTSFTVEDSDEENGDGPGTGDPTPTPTPTETPTEEPTVTETPTETPTEDSTPTPTETPTEEQTPTETSNETPTEEPTPTDTSTVTPTEEPTPTDDGVITPAQTEEPTSESVPLTGIPQFLVALLVLALAARIRSRG